MHNWFIYWTTSMTALQHYNINILQLFSVPLHHPILIEPLKSRPTWKQHTASTMHCATLWFDDNMLSNATTTNVHRPTLTSQHGWGVIGQPPYQNTQQDSQFHTTDMSSKVIYITIIQVSKWYNLGLQIVNNHEPSDESQTYSPPIHYFKCLLQHLKLKVKMCLI